MARIIKHKHLKNTRLAASYGGWVYCTNCDENIGYLCYATYDKLKLNYVCNCGSSGEVHIELEDDKTYVKDNNQLILVKNRLCCPTDRSPLITVLNNKIKSYNFEITCNACKKAFEGERK